MKKYLATMAVTALAGAISASAFAFEIGERSAKFYNETLNTANHNFHMVVVQKIDMSEIMSADAYQQLKPAQRVRYNRFEYNETSALSAERQTTFDGYGRVVKDVNSFARGNQWYSVDYVNKTYDRLPELPGMVKSIKDLFTPYFADNMPEGGFDEFTGYDYDRRYKADKEMYFYFEKDTDVLKGYEISSNPRYNIVELSEEVDVEKAFALPPEDFRRQANEAMRAFATKLVNKTGDAGAVKSKKKK